MSCDGVIFFNPKAYDANGGKHSTIELAKKVRTALWLSVEGVAFDCLLVDCADLQISFLFFDGVKALKQAEKFLPAGKMTLGLPFYARHIRTGNWVSYEDVVGKIVEKQVSSGQVPTLDPTNDILGEDYFNGVDTIRVKTILGLESPACGEW